MSQSIILTNGDKVALKDFQKANNLSGDDVAKYFSASELDCEGELEIAEPLLKVLDLFREKIGKSVKINSGYRSDAKQKALKKAGYKAATNSPHCVGMAADIDTISREQTYAYVKVLKSVSKELKIKIRLGYEQYLDLGQTFVHVDVCPEYFAKGKPFNSKSHPAVWEAANEW